MIIWEYLKWAWKRKVPVLLFRCLLAMVFSVAIAWMGGVLFAAFARGFFWGVKVWVSR